MLCHLQGRKPFIRHLENGGRFLAYVGFGVMVTGLKQFGPLLLTEGESQLFGHEGSFLEKQMFHLFYHIPLAITSLIF